MHTQSLIFSSKAAPSKPKLYWMLQIGGWASYAAYLIIFVDISENTRLESTLDIIFTTTCLLFLSHGYRSVIKKYNWTKLVFVKLILRIFLASILLPVLAIPFAYLSSYLFDPSKLATGFERQNLMLWIIGGAFLFFCWSVCYFFYHYISNYNRSLKWEAKANEFELNRLRSQLNPHFIFNALNSVKVLVDEDPEQARDSIDQLSNILRTSLMMGKKKVIPFNDELAIVKDYLALERTRFEERLQVKYDIDPTAFSFKVPPMMIQTLVENGLKHGIAKRMHGGLISLTTKVIEEGLLIQIRNSGNYNPPKKESTKGGYGLKSTLQRLELLYQQKARFSIQNEGEETVLVEMLVPHWEEQELNTTPPLVAV